MSNSRVLLLGATISSVACYHTTSKDDSSPTDPGEQPGDGDSGTGSDDSEPGTGTTGCDTDDGYTLSWPDDARCTIERVDISNDGTVNQIHLEVRAAGGDLLREDRDEDGDGNPELRRIYTYTLEGLLESMGADMLGDGQLESRTTYRYDASLNLIEEARDSGLDCTVDQLRRYRYSDDGLREVIESGPTGAVLRIETFVYDEDGRLIRKELDSGGDGSPSARTHYSYDETGKLALEVKDSGTDASTFLRRVYHYDDDGALLRMVQDSGDPDTPVLEIRYTYDDDGRLVVEDRDFRTGDDERIRYTFTPNDTLERIETDRRADGTVDEVRTFQSYCPIR